MIRILTHLFTRNMIYEGDMIYTGDLIYKVRIGLLWCACVYLADWLNICLNLDLNVFLRETSLYSAIRDEWNTIRGIVRLEIWGWVNNSLNPKLCFRTVVWNECWKTFYCHAVEYKEYSGFVRSCVVLCCHMGSMLSYVVLGCRMGSMLSYVVNITSKNPS